MKSKINKAIDNTFRETEVGTEEIKSIYFKWNRNKGINQSIWNAATDIKDK